jgi:activator of 2-hydroxyglutaryl-CoA dehydratase
MIRAIGFGRSSTATEETGEKMILPRYPQLMGAYGAALIAGSIREVTMSPRGGD